MPNRISDWEGTLSNINDLSKELGVTIDVTENEGFFDVIIKWGDDKKETYAENCFWDELEGVIFEAWVYIKGKDEVKKTKKRDRLIKETCVLLSKDLYDYFSEDGWGGACEHIVNLAEQFEKELDWQEDDMRDYMEELKKFEDKVLKKG